MLRIRVQETMSNFNQIGSVSWEVQKPDTDGDPKTKIQRFRDKLICITVLKAELQIVISIQTLLRRSRTECSARDMVSSADLLSLYTICSELTCPRDGRRCYDSYYYDSFKPLHLVDVRDTGW